MSTTESFKASFFIILFVIEIGSASTSKEYENSSHDSQLTAMQPDKICPRVSDQVGHKPGCTTREDGYRLKISNLGSRGIVLFTCK